MNFEYLINKEHIDLSFNSLHDGNIEVLVEVLEKSEVLGELNLWDNRIALADDKFTDALAQNRTLRVLSLGSNNITSDGMKRLAAALKVNQSVQELHMGDNCMGNDGAKSFADALTANTALQMISLYGNNIGDEGAQCLATSFKENQNLRVIWLHENKIGNDGAQSLVDALQCNHVIEKLFLLGNRITNRSIENEIQDVLADFAGRKRRAQDAQRVLAAAQHDKDAIVFSNDNGGDTTAKDKEIAMLKAALKSKDKEMKAQAEEIAALKMVLKNQITFKDAEIAGLKAVLDNSNTTTHMAEEIDLQSNTKSNTVSGVVVVESAFEDARDDTDNDPLILHAVASTE